MLSPVSLQTKGITSLDDFMRHLDEAYRLLRADVARGVGEATFNTGSELGDGQLNPGEVTAWIDETGHNLTFKAKLSDGTIETGTVALS